MFGSAIEKEIFRKSVREITFTPCITLPVVYDSTSENKLGRAEFDILKDNSKYISERKRHERLLKTLLITNINQNIPASQLITMPKIYDAVLKKKRIVLYNHVAQRLDFPTIDVNSPSSEIMGQIATIDNRHPAYETIIEYYPQYCTDKRTGVDFIEYILLLNISLTTKSRSLTMLQKLLKQPDNIEQINMWINRVRQSIYSTSVYMSYVDTFFSSFRYITAKKYNDAILILRDEYDEPESRNADVDYYTYMETNANMSELIEIHSKIIPTAWRLMNCNNENNPYKQKDLRWLETMDETIKSKANEYVVEVRSFIDKATEEAEAILPTLFQQP